MSSEYCEEINYQLSVWITELFKFYLQPRLGKFKNMPQFSPQFPAPSLKNLTRPIWLVSPNSDIEIRVEPTVTQNCVPLLYTYILFLSFLLKEQFFTGCGILFCELGICEPFVYMKMYALEASRLPNTTSAGFHTGLPCLKVEIGGSSAGNKSNLAILGKQLNKAIAEVRW